MTVAGASITHDGTGVGDGVGDGLGLGVGDGLGIGVGVAVGTGVGVGVTIGVGVGVGLACPGGHAPPPGTQCGAPGAYHELGPIVKLRMVNPPVASVALLM